MALLEADRRLLADLADIDDRGLELAEAIIHRERQREERNGGASPETHRALRAVSRVRDFSRPTRG